MRQNTAWTAFTAVAITAAIGLISQHGVKSPGGERTPAQTVSQQDRTGPAAETEMSLGPCANIESHLKSFLGMDDPRSTVVPSFCFDSSKRRATGAAQAEKTNRQQDVAMNRPPGRPFRLSFMIATLPDPTHTHFPLQFDRMSEAIQQGASDEGYVYDSS